MKLEKDKKTETITNLWMANNTDYDGLQLILKGIDPSWKSKPKEVSKEDTKKEWNRLKAFMGGRT